MRKHNRKALGLVEVSIAFAMIAVLSFIGLRMYSQSRDEGNATQIIGQASQIKAAVQSAYANQRNYEGLSNETIINSLPKSMEGLNNNIAMAGSVMATVLSDENNPNGPNRSYNFKITSMSDFICRKITAMDFGRDTINVSINGHNFDKKPTASEISTLCTQENNGADRNYIVISSI